MQALRAFEAAARTRSLSRAAESLHLTHGAISHQIKSLEADLGVRLVERAGRGIRLTDEGERFAARVRTVLSDLGDAVREVSERSNPTAVARQRHAVVRGSLAPAENRSASSPRTRRSTWMSAPAMRSPTSGATTSTSGFATGSGCGPGLHVEFVLDDVYFPVCSPRLAGGRLPARPADLSRYTLLRSEGDPWKPWFEAAGLDWAEPSRGPMFSDSSHTMQAAIEGQGIALARTSLLANDLRNGVLVRLFDIELPSPRKYFLVYPPRLADAPKLVAFRQWLFDEVALDEQAQAPRDDPRTSPAKRPSKASSAKGGRP